jgi:hypothetical protein
MSEIFIEDLFGSKLFDLRTPSRAHAQGAKFRSISISGFFYELFFRSSFLGRRRRAP